MVIYGTTWQTRSRSKKVLRRRRHEIKLKDGNIAVQGLVSSRIPSLERRNGIGNSEFRTKKINENSQFFALFVCDIVVSLVVLLRNPWNRTSYVRQVLIFLIIQNTRTRNVNLEMPSPDI